MNVAPQYFRTIRDGRKCIEGRLDRGKFASLRKGSTLVIRPSDGAYDKDDAVIVAVVTRKVHYVSFEQYLMQEGLARTLPGTKTIEKGVAAYRQFYSSEEEQKHGVVALHLHVCR